MSDYTPDAEAAEWIYVHHRSSRVNLIQAHHEFNRFINNIKAESWAEGCNAGLDCGLTVGEHVLGIKPGRIPAPPANPYKAES